MKHVRQLLDNTLEILIVVARVVTALLALAALPASIALAWTGDIRWLWTLLITFVASAVLGYVGFYVFGNEEWRHGKTEDRGA